MLTLCLHCFFVCFYVSWYKCVPTSCFPLSILTQGYIQRRLMKAMEGIIVSYDGTVRNSNRQLTQLRYGEDGMDGAFMEFQQLPSIKPSHASFKRRFYFDCADQR